MVDPISLRHHRPFVHFWCARVATTIAYQIATVAVGWKVYELTGSALALGLIGLVQFVPVVLFTLIVGHVADRYDRRRVVRVSQLTEAAATLFLAVGSAGDWLTPGVLFAIVFVTGSTRAFVLPSIHALLPALVPTGLFSRAVAGSASANQTAIIIGPALGGLLYVAGPAVAFAASSAIFGVAALLTSLIRLDQARQARAPLSLQSLLSGIAFIRERSAILGAISLDLFAVLLGGATALLPIYARDILETGPWGLGLLRSAPAVGALAASLVLARHPLKSRVGRTLFASIIAFGAATIVFGLSRSLPLSLAALAALGAADAVSVVIRFSLVQMRTPDEMRGRVSAVNSMFIGASNTLGEFESGITAAWLGAVPAVLLGGIGTILVALLWMRMFPDLRRMDRLEMARRE
jgi:MFS family permease